MGGREVNMKKGIQQQVRIRIISVACVLLFCGGAIMARLYYLQVVDHEKLASRAASQIHEEIRIAPKRGDISDRHGRKLAVNVEVDSVFGVPSRVEDPHRTAKVLSQATGVRKDLLLRKLKKDRPFVWLARRISPSRISQVKALDLEGIGFLQENRRYYPQRQLAAQLVGLAGIDSQGLEGIELHYDDFLLRDAVWLVAEKDAYGRDILLSGPTPEALEGGAEVRLTIDEVIQHIAQKELARGVRESGAKGGCIVILEPQTGEVLAMANLPFFNPNNFQSYGPRYFRNRAVSDLVEPGSILKPVLLAAALEEKAVTLRTLFFCENGAMPFMGRILHDVHPHGYLDAEGVITNSSNIGATKIAQKLGPEKYHHYLRKFGFGQKTGIDLPGEAEGLLRSVPEWSGLSISALAIGQEISVTPLQMAVAYAALVNGGALMEPYAVGAVTGDDGAVLRQRTPSRVRDVVSAETSRLVRSTLGKVVTSGTGADASVEGYSVGGKTGTAQKYDSRLKSYSSKRYLASFTGYAPHDEPRLVVVVMIDEPKETIWGGSVAGPVFRRVVGRVLRYMNVPPSEGGRTLVVES
jgi:cell division protein FtsI (penicillin-binding protein 3)